MNTNWSKKQVFYFNNAMKIHNIYCYFCCCTKLATGTPDEAISESEISDPDSSSESSNSSSIPIWPRSEARWGPTLFRSDWSASALSIMSSKLTSVEEVGRFGRPRREPF